MLHEWTQPDDGFRLEPAGTAALDVGVTDFPAVAADESWRSILAGLPKVSMSFSGTLEPSPELDQLIGPPKPILFEVRWDPEDREYTQDDADAMVGKLMRIELADFLRVEPLIGTITGAVVEAGERALLLTGEMEPDAGGGTRSGVSRAGQDHCGPSVP